jgi:dihydroxy-acid dehydratase
MRDTATETAQKLFASAPGYKPNLVLGSQNNYFKNLDEDRISGCIRDVEHAYSQDGGLAVLYGNIATAGCIVKTAGIDQTLFHFEGIARVFESQDEAVNGILGKKVNPGDIVVIRYEGPKGGPGMQEMLYPTSYLKTLKLDKDCALITDGRFSGGTSGLSIGHISPEAAAGGEIALIQNGDRIQIDIKNRSINLDVTNAELQERRLRENMRKTPFTPVTRNRTVSKALKLYAMHVSSADKGAVRIIE